MSFAGDVRTGDRPDLLGWINARKKTGTLRLQRRATQKRLAFQKGRLHSSWSNDPRESLGQVLVRDQLLSEQALFEALVRQEKEGRLLGGILVSQGLLVESQLTRALRGKAEEVVYDLFLWSDGRFDFEDDQPVPENPVVNLDVDTAMVIQEGVHRREEGQKLPGWVPPSDLALQSPRAAARGDEKPPRHGPGLSRARQTPARISPA